MTTHKEKLGAVNGRVMELFKAEQGTMTAFKALSDAATKEGTVTSAMKETIAVALAVSKGCEDCILFHVDAAKKHGADRETLVEVLAVAIEMSGGPGVVYAAKAVEAFDSL